MRDTRNGFGTFAIFCLFNQINYSAVLVGIQMLIRCDTWVVLNIICKSCKIVVIS